MNKYIKYLALFLALLLVPMCDCDCECDFDDDDQIVITPDPSDCIPFYDLVIVRWHSNTLTVINNPANNGGYDFSNAQYQWYRNGTVIRNSNRQSLTSNSDGGSLEAGNYYVEISFSGGILRTCTEFVAFGVNQ